MSTKTHNKPIAPIKSYEEISQAWEKIQYLDIKNKYKMMKALAYDICNAYTQPNIEAQQLGFYIDVLRKVNKIHRMDRSRIALAKMITRWLDLTGNAQIKILKKIRGQFNVESASVAVGDPSYSLALNHAYENYAENKVVNLMNAGKIFIFVIGSDGCPNIQIRFIEAAEPVLSASEYKHVINSTDAAIINIPTGIMVFADPFYLDTQGERLSVNVVPGNYKLAAYHYLRGENEIFYIVFCKTDLEAKNEFVNLPDFG